MHPDAYGEMIGTVCITKWMKRSHNGMAWMSLFRSGDVLFAAWWPTAAPAVVVAPKRRRV